MKRKIAYPFAPKSTAYMHAGQYWPIRLKSGKYACGAVVSLIRNENGKIDTRAFLAGLLDWVGDSPPTPEEISSTKILEKGFAHIKTITESGAEITGAIEPCWGYPEIMEERDDIHTWGYNVINILAEKFFEN